MSPPLLLVQCTSFKLQHFTQHASCRDLLEDGADSVTHVCERDLPIFISVQHVKGLSCMLGIHEVLNVLHNNVGPAADLAFRSLQDMWW